MSSPKSPHVLIIGGGLGGLTLAQCLRKNNLSFQVFERDSNDHSRTQGWALSLHWYDILSPPRYILTQTRSLPELESKLPNDLGYFEQCSVLKNLHILDGGSIYDDKGEKTVTFGGPGEEKL